jgi:glycosyltransferase involved in cell wall biosynthesis
MRLLVLTSSYPTTDNPGGGIFIREMLEHLPAPVEIVVVTPDTAEENAVEHGQSYLSVKRVRYGPKALQMIANRPGGIPAALKTYPWLVLLLPMWALAMFTAILRLAGKHDLIHTHWSICGLIGGVAGCLKRVPVVTTLHGTDVDWAERFGLLRIILMLCFKLSNRVVAVSSAMARKLQSRWPQWQHKILTIPNGVSSAYFSTPDKKFSANSDEFVFTSVGNLIPGKQVDLTVRAFHRLVQSGRSARLVIAGGGPCDSGLRHLAQGLGLKAKIEFTGAIPPAQVARLMRRTHALVLASEREGRPTIVMEAMAAGVAVIASDIDGVREMIEPGQTGLLFNVGDIETLAAHMAALMDQPARTRQIAQRARRWMIDRNLTWQNTAAQYLKIYTSLAGEGR